MSTQRPPKGTKHDRAHASSETQSYVRQDLRNWFLTSCTAQSSRQTCFYAHAFSVTAESHPCQNIVIWAAWMYWLFLLVFSPTPEVFSSLQRPFSNLTLYLPSHKLDSKSGLLRPLLAPPCTLYHVQHPVTLGWFSFHLIHFWRKQTNDQPTHNIQQ